MNTTPIRHINDLGRCATSGWENGHLTPAQDAAQTAYDRETNHHRGLVAAEQAARHVLDEGGIVRKKRAIIARSIQENIAVTALQ